MSTHFGVDAIPVRDLGLREASDRRIFDAARSTGAVVMTKDVDFVGILERLGPPPQVLWVTCGNTSDAQLREILGDVFGTAVEMLAAGEPLVEVG